MDDLLSLDLTRIDPAAMISKHFSFREALYLHTWGRMAGPADGLTHDVLARIAWFLRTQMDEVRDWLGAPINVHCCWRPKLYNQDPRIKGSTHSTHMALVDYRGKPLFPEEMIAAMDFDVEGFKCDDIRTKLFPQLEIWGLRMEDRPGSDWVHLDSSPPIPPLFHRLVKG